MAARCLWCNKQHSTSNVWTNNHKKYTLYHYQRFPNNVTAATFYQCMYPLSLIAKNFQESQLNSRRFPGVVDTPSNDKFTSIKTTEKHWQYNREYMHTHTQIHTQPHKVLTQWVSVPLSIKTWQIKEITPLAKWLWQI